MSCRVRVGGRKGAKEVMSQEVATPSVRVVTNRGHSLCVQAVVTSGTAPGSVRWVVVCVGNVVQIMFVCDCMKIFLRLILKL